MRLPQRSGARHESLPSKRACAGESWSTIWRVRSIERTVLHGIRSMCWIGMARSRSGVPGIFPRRSTPRSVPSKVLRDRLLARRSKWPRYLGDRPSGFVCSSVVDARLCSTSIVVPRFRSAGVSRNRHPLRCDPHSRGKRSDHRRLRREGSTLCGERRHQAELLCWCGRRAAAPIRR